MAQTLKGLERGTGSSWSARTLAPGTPLAAALSNRRGCCNLATRLIAHDRHVPRGVQAIAAPSVRTDVSHELVALHAHAHWAPEAVSAVTRSPIHPTRRRGWRQHQVKDGFRAYGRSRIVTSSTPFLLAAVTASQPAGGLVASSPAPALVAALLGPGLPALLISIGVSSLCLAGAAFLIAAIPTLLALARLAMQATAVLRLLEKELPDTAALLRLTGLQLHDCMADLGSLGNDLSEGLRSTAKLATAAESGVRQAAAVTGQAIVPALAAGETAARGVVEAGLQERAKLPSLVTVHKVVSGARDMTKRLRMGVAAAGLAQAALGLGQAARRAVQERAAANVLMAAAEANTGSQAKG